MLVGLNFCFQKLPSSRGPKKLVFKGHISFIGNHGIIYLLVSFYRKDTPYEIIIYATTTIPCQNCVFFPFAAVFSSLAPLPLPDPTSNLPAMDQNLLNDSHSRHALLNKDYHSISQLSQTERELLAEYQRLVRNLDQVSCTMSAVSPVALLTR
jgi:hypothetical protein